jgi:hypothetical protein
MKTFSRAAAIAAVIIGTSAVPTLAASITSTDLGSFSGLTGSDSALLGRTIPDGSVSFTDTYTFKITNTSLIGAAITQAYTTAAQIIGNFTVTLFGGTPSTGTQLATGTATSGFLGFQSGGFSPVKEAVGSYYLVVTGNTSGTPTYGGSLALSVSAVPLPASLPMFGGALLALAGFGYGMNRWVAPKSKAGAASA